MLLTLVVGLLLQASPSTMQPAAPADPWSRIRFMIGEWQGESEGQPGKGTVKRTHAFVLHDRFLYEGRLPGRVRRDLRARLRGRPEIYSKARFKRVRRP